MRRSRILRCLPGVRRIEHVEDRQPRVLEHRAELRELEEALVAVVVAHAARADAAERHVVLRDVQHAVVDRDAAGDRRVEQLLLDRLVVGEDVEAERPVLAVHVRDHLVERRVGLHREQRAEDLVLHDDHVVGDVEDEVRRDLAQLVVERRADGTSGTISAPFARASSSVARSRPVRLLVDHRRVAAASWCRDSARA